MNIDIDAINTGLSVIGIAGLGFVTWLGRAYVIWNKAKKEASTLSKIENKTNLDTVLLLSTEVNKLKDEVKELQVALISALELAKSLETRLKDSERNTRKKLGMD